MRQVTLLVLIFALLAACTPQTESTADATAAPLTSGETALPTQSIFAPPPSVLWTEVRDERFGFGIAIPCWWQVAPMPAEGVISTMTVRNYDEQFFLAYSENGVWKGGRPPQGVMSMDITAITGIDPSLSMLDAYLQYVDTSTYAVLSTQEKIINDKVYTVVAMKNQINPNEPASVVYLKGLTPDSILIFRAFPTEAIFSADALTILGSFASVPDETIVLPNVMPSPALIGAACAF